MSVDINNIFSIVSDYCNAIYYGGSRVDPVISNPHDYDYICFAKHLHRQSLIRCLYKNNLKQKHYINNCKKACTLDKPDYDFSQIRVYPYTQITWFSYLDILMIKVVGEDVCPKTDIINEHREEFIGCLKTKMDSLLHGKIHNQKRWYHLLRGAYILINNSYEVTPEQKAEINMLHDLSEGWEKVRDKTIELINTLQ